MSLRPIQAIALFEVQSVGGLVAPVAVGGGKTLISGLIPYVMKARRPLLITRANLIAKTKREFAELAHHWPIPNFIRIVSYEGLGRASQKDLLANYVPDIIVCDEAHRIKNPRAAVTRRVTRYMSEYPHTRFVAMSGTITRRSLKDYAHLVLWSLKPAHSPVPATYSEIEEWAEALDERSEQRGPRQVYPGALLTLCSPEERRLTDEVFAARQAFGRRLVETPGVVATAGKDEIGSSCTIQAIECAMTPAVDDAFRTLRTAWRTPDDWPLADAMSVWRHARELALGFYYRWEPRPPKEWIEPRREWAAMCRYILQTNRRNLDSELQVLNAVDNGLYPEATPVLEAWRKVKKSFVPNTTPVWLDDAVIDLAARWAAVEPGIVWCEHVAFAERLAWKTNLAYYGKGGLDRFGRPIEAHDPNTSLIASVEANAEGRNLQLWHRNLITSCPTSGIRWEQIPGRTLRPGQQADEVTFDVVVTCLEHVLAFEQARREARYQEQKTGHIQILNFADIVMPSSEEVSSRNGPRWCK